MYPVVIFFLSTAIIILPQVALSQNASNTPMPAGASACLDGARKLVPFIDGERFDLGQGVVCTQEDTGFFGVRVRYHFTSNLPRGGLPRLFNQRTDLYVDAEREGREARLTYAITPSDITDIWDVTVTDSLGNTREDSDYIWARNFRELDGTAPAALLLGRPIVYFECSDRQDRTCVAIYNIDTCHRAPHVSGSDAAQPTYYYDISLSAVGPANVTRLLNDFEPVNQVAERLIEEISPAVCESAK